MSMIESSTSKSALAAATDTPMLTPEQVVEQLRAMRQRIPEFVQLPKGEVRQIRRTANVNPDLTREAIDTIGASEMMQSVIGNTPGELHQAEDELARWSTVESELRSMHRGVSLANLVRRHRLGRVALQAYSVGRQLVRQEEHAQLLPHVENMSRIRKFARRRPKPAAEPEPPQEQPQQAKPS